MPTEFMFDASHQRGRFAARARYEIGDHAVAAEGRCGCGRTLPLIGRIIGRGMNLFRIGDGRLISPWPFCIAVWQRPEVKQFQIVQTAVSKIHPPIGYRLRPKRLNRSR